MTYISRGGPGAQRGSTPPYGAGGSRLLTWMVVLFLVAAACHLLGGSTADPQGPTVARAELESVTTRYLEQIGRRTDSGVTCPGDLVAVVGRTLVCGAGFGGRRADVALLVSTIQADRVTWDVAVR